MALAISVSLATHTAFPATDAAVVEDASPKGVAEVELASLPKRKVIPRT